MNTNTAFKVTTPATKVTEAGSTIVLAPTAQKAKDTILAAHREALGMPGFFAFLTVEPHVIKVGDRFPGVTA